MYRNPGIAAARTLGLSLSLLGLLLALALPAASSAAGCPNEALRVGPSAHLPDCRAYEQVSPVQKDGGQIGLQSLGVNAAGEPTVAIEGFAAFAGAESLEGTPGGFYSIGRTAAGWVTTPMDLPASQYEIKSGLLLINSLDQSSQLSYAKAKSQPEGPVDFITHTTTGATAEIGPMTPPGIPPEAEANNFNHGIRDGEWDQIEGVSADLSHVLFTIDPRTVEGSGFFYWPFDETILNPLGNNANPDDSLYEYVGTGNAAPMLVGVDNEGKLISRCQTALGGETQHNLHEPGGENHNAVSGDGDTVFFTAFGHREDTGLPCPAGARAPEVNEVYARIDNGQADAHTVSISEPSKEDCPTCDTSEGALEPAVFIGASEDGSKVFFTTRQPLLGGDSSNNLYEYDFEPPAGQPKVVRVSGGDGTVTDPTAEVESVVQTSEDGSHAYFVARGVLTRTANDEGQEAQAGANNLYVFERDAQYPAGRTAFIGDLESADLNEKGNISKNSVMEADVTPDGRFLVFLSAAHLTPDDTSPDEQVFEYDAQTGSLVRVSIGEDGYDNNGNNETDSIGIKYPEYPLSEPTGYWSHLTLSADGAYVFFESSAALTPQALNNAHVTEAVGGVPIVKTLENVYEYHAGHVYLISDGQDLVHGGDLVGTDASGTDVFFKSADKLAPQDTDTDEDFYDARIDGGFPAPSAPVECSGDGCQGPLSAAPVLLSPGSEFQAGGNPASPTAAPPAVKPKALTRTQELAAALRSCRKEKSKTRRKRCEAAAHRKYGAAKTAKKSSVNRRAGR